MKSLRLALASGAFLSMLATGSALAGTDPYLGEIMLVPYTFCPAGWVEADGRQLSIGQYSALYSLFGTAFGSGGGTFAVPDLRGRVPQGVGQGPGLQNYALGQALGAESLTLTGSYLPQHTHTLYASSGAPAVGTPTGNALATYPAAVKVYATGGSAPNAPFTAASVSMAGSSSPILNTSKYQPTLTLRYCIATQGAYPSRN